MKAIDRLMTYLAFAGFAFAAVHFVLVMLYALLAYPIIRA